MQIIITKKEVIAGQAGLLKVKLLIQELGGHDAVKIETFEDIVTGSPAKGVIIVNDGENINISVNEDMVIDAIAVAAKLAKPYIKLAASLKLVVALFRTDISDLQKKVKKFQKKWN